MKKPSLSICSECLHLVIKNIGHNCNVTSFEDNRRHFLSILFVTSVWLREIHPHFTSKNLLIWIQKEYKLYHYPLYNIYTVDNIQSAVKNNEKDFHSLKVIFFFFSLQNCILSVNSRKVNKANDWYRNRYIFVRKLQKSNKTIPNHLLLIMQQ